MGLLREAIVRLAACKYFEKELTAALVLVEAQLSALTRQSLQNTRKLPTRTEKVARFVASRI